MKRRIFCVFIVVLISLSSNGYSVSAEDGSQNDMSAVSEPTIIKTEIAMNGEREYLSPNLIGLQNIAISNLPLTINFINIIDAFREIVNGVRYEIVLNAINNTNASDSSSNEIICRLVIFEKPWITTEWGDKHRELSYSNCSTTLDNSNEDNSKVISEKYKSNTLFDSKNTELSEDDMARLDAQIIPQVVLKNSKKTSDGDSNDNSGTEEQSAVVTPEIILNDNDDITETSKVETTTPQTETEEPMVDSTTSTTTEIIPDLNDDSKKWLDSFFSVVTFNDKLNIKNTQVDNNVEIKSFQDKPIGETTGNSIDSNRERQEQVDNESNIRTKRSNNNSIPGAPFESMDDAEEVLKKSLGAIVQGAGESYEISRIFSSRKQIVSGSSHVIQAELKHGDELINCTVTIWSRSWLPNGIETTLKCPNKEKLVVRHNRDVEYAEKKTHKKSIHGNIDKSEHLFLKFQNRYSKTYHNTMERQMRYRIFKHNLKLIEELNRMEQGTAKYGVTEFADLTSAEYKQRTGLLPRSENNRIRNKLAEIPDFKLPKEFDWRKRGVVSKVKNQGQCGSCWAFSVTGNIEGLHAVKTGKLEEYSEQELLDCDTVDSACNGGLPDNAYEAIEKIGGLELESDYPYDAKKGQCHFNKTLSHVQVKGAVDLPKNETAMALWLVANGPISIGINANAMQFYRGGVSHPWRPLCRHGSIDHGVLIVGFGISDYPLFNKTLPYWVVKNSWGSKWGEQGYYRVFRGDNTCGINSMASSAVLE